MSKVWFITGASRGIGLEITKTALKNGDYVIATARKVNDINVDDIYIDRILNLQLDVANYTEEQINEKVKQAAGYFGRIDVLVNNAGHGRITNFEETSEENIREIFVKVIKERYWKIYPRFYCIKDIREFLNAEGIFVQAVMRLIYNFVGLKMQDWLELTGFFLFWKIHFYVSAKTIRRA